METDSQLRDAVSQLHELQSQNYLRELEFHFDQPEPPLWVASASVGVQHERQTLKLNVSMQKSESKRKKQDAKQHAAAQLLNSIRRFPSLSTWVPNVTYPQGLKPRQYRMLDRAGIEANKIKAMYSSTIERGATVICIDLEIFDQSSEVSALEVGIASITFADGMELPIEARHLIIGDHVHLVNKYTPNNRHNFKVGVSEYIPNEELSTRMQAIIKQIVRSDVPVFLANCGVQNDVKWLAALGIDIHALVSGVQVVDIGQAFMFMSRETELRGLGKILQSYQIHIPEETQHNGGMDALHGLFAALLVGGDLYYQE